MPFEQLIVDVRRDQADTAETALWAVGPFAVTLQEPPQGASPILEPAPGQTPLWDTVRLSALFAESAAAEQACRLLEAVLAPAAPIRVAVAPLADRAWEREWLRDFRPMRFGRRLWVCPSDIDPPAGAATVLRLDPGLAFGTGTHATTALCLEWLEQRVGSGDRLLDYGCGSGILGIAAALLGAAHSCCVDHDPQALEATSANAGRNGVGERVHCFAPAAIPATTFDLVVANILARPLVDLAERIAALARPGAQMALSGLLGSQIGEVSDAYRPWFDMAEVRHSESWALVSGRRRSD